MARATTLVSPASTSTTSATGTGAAVTAGRARPAARRSMDPHLCAVVAPASFEAAQYRRIALSLERLRAVRKAQVVAFSSAMTGEGKTLTVVNTAGSLAQGRERKVLVIDADLRRPAVRRYLGLSAGGPGLGDVVRDGALRLNDVVRRDPAIDFDILGAGRQAGVTPYETLQSPRLRTLLSEARERYDYVLIDTPPLLAVPDGQMLAELTDGVILVVRAHQTSRRHLADVVRDHGQLKIVGIVFNSDDECGRGYDRSYYR